MKKFIIFLSFLPFYLVGQSFHYSKIIINHDTLNQQGMFLIKDFGNNNIEFTLFPNKDGINEFSNIVFLVFDSRVFFKTNDPVFFSHFLDVSVLNRFDNKIEILSDKRIFHFIK